MVTGWAKNAKLKEEFRLICRRINDLGIEQHRHHARGSDARSPSLEFRFPPGEAVHAVG